MAKIKPTPYAKRVKEAIAGNPKILGLTEHEAAELLARRAARKQQNHTLDPNRYGD